MIEIEVKPEFGSVVIHQFELITAEQDTVFFYADVIGDPVMGSRLLFQGRDRGYFVLGRVRAVDR